ncbi:MAG: thioredoxin-dependent thiol peroxidase [Alphaproteobacteria bacterium]|nr:thioredoxin-dependent thiol peroxidase [Alphaproteobacteria bacterium]
MKLEIGDKAPEFTLPTDGGGTVSLKTLRGRKVIVYFYPKDDTSGCTAEACGFRDSMPDFRKANAEIIGISKDTVAKHDKFKAKHDLNFTLASDIDGGVVEAYGVWVKKRMFDRHYMGIERSTFLIDEKGVLRAIWRKVNLAEHVAEVLAAAKRLKPGA